MQAVFIFAPNNHLLTAALDTSPSYPYHHELTDTELLCVTAAGNTATMDSI